jgi:hypothetical protein
VPFFLAHRSSHLTCRTLDISLSLAADKGDTHSTPFIISRGESNCLARSRWHEWQAPERRSQLPRWKEWRCGRKQFRDRACETTIHSCVIHNHQIDRVCISRSISPFLVSNTGKARSSGFHNSFNLPRFSDTPIMKRCSDNQEAHRNTTSMDLDRASC